ncbi:hypothetical protein YC2023_027018 [Brassica napus]
MGPKGIGKLYRRLAKNEMWHEGVVVVSLTNNSHREREIIYSFLQKPDEFTSQINFAPRVNPEKVSGVLCRIGSKTATKSKSRLQTKECLFSSSSSYLSSSPPEKVLESSVLNPSFFFSFFPEAVIRMQICFLYFAPYSLIK